MLWHNGNIRFECDNELRENESYGIQINPSFQLSYHHTMHYFHNFDQYFS